jgi:tetratricopeptide (TPR) repeat protein
MPAPANPLKRLRIPTFSGIRLPHAPPAKPRASSRFHDESPAIEARVGMNRYDAGVYPRSALNPEETMRKTRLLAAAILVSAVAGAPGIAAAVENANPGAPPQAAQPSAPSNAKKKVKKPQKSSSAEDFLAGYHGAYALIYDQGDYAGGIAALRALGYDDNADVATLIGYASRKLGRYDDAKYWYDKALAADPNHAVTWSYYGMWHAEQGNVLKAKDDLAKVAAICGNTVCREYKALKDVIDGTVTY